MVSKIIILLLLCIFFFKSTMIASAESSYVLPYPSFMPGNILYKPRLVLNKLSYYIYFGDFGRFDYFLKESDHYLVEAKVLFEYKQYLLGSEALEKSNFYFMQINSYLQKAEKNGKNISERKKLLKEASLKHIEEIDDLKEKLPNEFNWTPEKKDSTKIDFESLLNSSIKIRKSML